MGYTRSYERFDMGKDDRVVIVYKRGQSSRPAQTLEEAMEGAINRAVRTGYRQSIRRGRFGWWYMRPIGPESNHIHIQYHNI